MKFSARILLVFSLFFIFSFFFSVPHISAQTVDPSTITNNNPDVPKNLHNWTQNVMIEVMSAVTCQLTGVDPINKNQACLGVDQKTGKIGFVQNGGGAINFMGSMITMLYTPPIHTKDYINYLSSNFGVVKPAYAVTSGLCTTSVGLCSITPLIKLWTVFRNIVYLLFVIIFVIIGLAIMLRIKIDPRTVMSIENQIPKIIIGLLLVTFSFAIAGFLIDMMYVLIYLIFNVFNDPNIICNGASSCPALDKIVNTQLRIDGENPLGVFNNLIGILDVVGSTSGAVKEIVNSLLAVRSPAVAGGGWFMLIRPAEFLSNAFSLILGGVISGLAFLIIAIAVLWALFRLWFQLIMAYVFILIDILVGPFLIISGVLPGGPGIGAWLRDFIANLLAFPLTIIMFLLGRVFIESFKNSGTPVFIPPLIGDPRPTGGSPEPLGALIGLGIILMTPQVVTMMKDALKAPKFPYVAAIGQAAGVGATTIKNIASTTALGTFGASKPGEKGFGAVARKLIGI